MTSAAPNAPVTRGASKTPISISDSNRRNRVLRPQQCVDNRAKLQNIRNLMASADREHRMMIAELDRLDREGRVWLVVDLVHKTSLASLDLAAGFLGTIGGASGEAADKISSTTRGISDNIELLGKVTSGEASISEVARSVMKGTAARVDREGAGGALLRGKVDTINTLWSGYEQVAQAQGTAQKQARAIETSVDTLGSLVQSNAEVLDKATQGGNPAARRVKAAAGIARAMAGFNREIEGAFDRRLVIRSDLMNSRYQLDASMRVAMERFRRQANELLAELEGCQAEM